MSKDKIDTKKLKPHPLGSIFPPMGDDEYSNLKSSLKARGFDPEQPIYLYEGQILDGNHRYTASKATKTEPVFKQYVGTDPIGFVIGKNLARRNLTPSQLATLGAELLEKIKQQEREEKEAEKERAKKAAEKAKAEGRKAPKAKPARGKGDKAKKAAKAVNVSPRSVAAAAALKKENPAAFEDVKSGKTTLNAATTETAVKKSAEQRKSEEYQTSCRIVDRICGEGFSTIIEKKLSAKDVNKLAGIDEAELLRIKPLLEAGWSVKMAVGYRATNLTYAHNIRQLTDRATAQGGNFFFEIDDFEITVAQKSKKADSPE